MVEVKKEIETLENEISDGNNKVSEISADLQNIETKLLKSQEMERRLSDNIHYRKIINEIKVLDTQGEELYSEMEKLPKKEQIREKQKENQKLLEEAKMKVWIHLLLKSFFFYLSFNLIFFFK